MDDRREHELLKRIEALEAMVIELQARNAELMARNADLEQELRRRGKNYRPKPNGQSKPTGQPDRRTKPHRKHGGVFRTAPKVDEQTIEYQVHAETCPHCGSCDLTPTGQHQDHLIEEIPPPRVEVHRYRRHEYQCRQCQQTLLGRGEGELPRAALGPRARLVAGYARAHLGISLGKTADLLSTLFGLSVSRAGLLGHVRWTGKLCAPVVQRFLTLLRQAAVVHADETGWRINGKNVWAWCFSNSQLAVFLIDEHRSGQVIVDALGDSLPGVLVSDFYAAYNRLCCRKQRCLTHLLRELHSLREELKPTFVTRHIEPLIELFQDAFAVARRRDAMSAAELAVAKREFLDRLDDRLYCRSKDPDCERIYARLERHREELFTFLDNVRVPPDNNAAERDIRSVAAARADGGVNRSAWGATAFANVKSVVRTCQKNGRNFLGYGLELCSAVLSGAPPPLPLAAG